MDAYMHLIPSNYSGLHHINGVTMTSIFAGQEEVHSLLQHVIVFSNNFCATKTWHFFIFNIQSLVINL